MCVFFTPKNQVTQSQISDVGFWLNNGDGGCFLFSSFNEVFIGYA